MYKFINIITNDIILIKPCNIINKISLLSYNDIYNIYNNNNNIINNNDISLPSIYTMLRLRFINDNEYTYIGNNMMIYINSFNKT